MLSGVAAVRQVLTVYVQENAISLPSSFDGQIMVVTVVTGDGTFDVTAVTMRETQGLIRLVNTERSPAFPLRGIKSVSVKYACQEVLTAGL